MIYHITKAYYSSLINLLSTKVYRAKKPDVLAYLNKMTGILHGVKDIVVV